MFLRLLPLDEALQTCFMNGCLMSKFSAFSLVHQWKFAASSASSSGYNRYFIGVQGHVSSGWNNISLVYRRHLWISATTNNLITSSLPSTSCPCFGVITESPQTGNSKVFSNGIQRRVTLEKYTQHFWKRRQSWVFDSKPQGEGARARQRLPSLRGERLVAHFDSEALQDI